MIQRHACSSPRTCPVPPTCPRLKPRPVPTFKRACNTHAWLRAVYGYMAASIDAFKPKQLAAGINVMARLGFYNGELAAALLFKMGRCMSQVRLEVVIKGEGLRRGQQGVVTRRRRLCAPRCCGVRLCGYMRHHARPGGWAQRASHPAPLAADGRRVWRRVLGAGQDGGGAAGRRVGDRLCAAQHAAAAQVHAGGWRAAPAPWLDAAACTRPPRLAPQPSLVPRAYGAPDPPPCPPPCFLGHRLSWPTW